MNEIVNRLMENKQVELAKSILESKGYRVTKKINESEQSEKDYARRVSRYQHPNDSVGFPAYDDEAYEEERAEGEAREEAFVSKRRKEERAPEDYEYSGILDKFIKKTPDGKNFSIWNESKDMKETSIPRAHGNEKDSPIKKKFWSLYQKDRDTQSKIVQAMTHYGVLDDVDNGGLTDDIARKVLAKAGLDGKRISIEDPSTPTKVYHIPRAGWEYHEYSAGSRGPQEATQFFKEVGGLYLTIYPPQRVSRNNTAGRDWHVEVESIDGETDPVNTYKTGFSSFEEAEAWIYRWVKDHGYHINESRRARRERNLTMY